MKLDRASHCFSLRLLAGKQSHPFYGWSFTSGIDEKKPPHPEKLVIYEGVIKQFIEEPDRYGNAYFIDVQTENEIKRLWFVSPITRFWRVLRNDYTSARLRVYGRPYGAKRVHVWELHANGKVLFNYNDRIQMGKEETSRFKGMSFKAILVCLVLLIAIFAYEKKSHCKK